VNATKVASPPAMSRPPTRTATDEGLTLRGLYFGLLLAIPFWLLIAVMTLAVLSGT